MTCSWIRERIIQGTEKESGVYPSSSDPGSAFMPLIGHKSTNYVLLDESNVAL